MKIVITSLPEQEGDAAGSIVRFVDVPLISSDSERDSNSAKAIEHGAGMLASVDPKPPASNDEKTAPKPKKMLLAEHRNSQG